MIAAAISLEQPGIRGLGMNTTFVGVIGLCLLALGVSKGAAMEVDRATFPNMLPVTPVVVFGADQRASAENFAASHHTNALALRRDYAATGIVRCGNAHGSGQLTLADDVVTTAAHVIYDRDGKLRGDREHCHFIIEANGQQISTELEVEGAIVGSSDPYNQDAVHDWAVVKLVHPVHEATPYGLGKPNGEGPVRFVARGAIDWANAWDMSLQDCRLRAGLGDGAEGTREFSFDCAANVGASGSGLFDGDGKGLLAIFVGYRSVDPDHPLPFSATHYNFAVTIEGAFRRAVEQQAALRTAAK